MPLPKFGVMAVMRQNYVLCVIPQTPKHSSYYIVLHFDSKKQIPFNKTPNLHERNNTFRAKIRRLSDFLGIN